MDADFGQRAESRIPADGWANRMTSIRQTTRLVVQRPQRHPRSSALLTWQIIVARGYFPMHW
jgi:hypothetical protein